MPATEVVAYIRSNTPMTESTEESLMLMMNSLDMAGIAFFTPCGNTTLRIACHCESPRLRAASVCPASIASMDARRTSAM